MSGSYLSVLVRLEGVCYNRDRYCSLAANFGW
jgi:hypothetical protein